MPPRIAIPRPLSRNPEYVERSLPQYERAIQLSGGEPVRIPLDRPLAEVGRMVEECDAVLLPGSSADIDPSKYGAAKHPKAAADDAPRDAVDEILLDDAYKNHKPILGICYGLQSLNVYCKGSLVQHIESSINHEAGRNVTVAHQAVIEPQSKLGEVLGVLKGGNPTVPVNSSHHQSAAEIGKGLRVVARSPEDGIVEALEGTSSEHFVLAVQWHPERSFDDEASKAIFRRFVEAAAAKREQSAARSKVASPK